MPRKILNEGIQCFLLRKYSLPVGRNYHLQTSDDADADQEPFWSFLLKKSFRLLKSLIVFLIEQPSQLKYIEWPSFQSTLKTATLTLLLVGLLIIALSSVDSALCYILALLSRRRV
ncbi:OLC1v1012941C1 [Oldenlandia corymbosa var. corymbosa]|uniref:OLC1v1012941C1 n=1 Tax=Oldenlandia corymbosa var. corymbosa TaxID=529605 RepID=A0AAV1E0C0_OLDCO|nr:OLC1v1012941C1 [Oldenlandia corymbosa var. corymbosa]